MNSGNMNHTSGAQLEANRRNAALSTGPRSPQGKAVASRNAVAHGLSGRITFQFPEEQIAYARLGQRFIVDYQPRTAIEEQLLHTIHDAQWQMNRCRAFDELIWKERAAGIFQRDDGLTTELVSRYLTMHTRTLFRAIAELRKTQNARKREERNLAIAAHELRTQQPYNRRKHGLILPLNGFVSQQSADWCFYAAKIDQAHTEIVNRRPPEAAETSK
jgi:hypothetical protein